MNPCNRKLSNMFFSPLKTHFAIAEMSIGNVIMVLTCQPIIAMFEKLFANNQKIYHNYF